MKKLTLGLAATVLLFSAPALAQVPGDSPTPATPTGSQAQSSTGKTTVTGVVVSSTADQLVLRTADGRQMVLAIGAESSLPRTQLEQGASITVDYQGDAVQGMSVVAVHEDRAAAPDPALIESDADPTAGSAADGRTELPQTASPIPLIGLLGLVALGGAALTRARLG